MSEHREGHNSGFSIDRDDIQGEAEVQHIEHKGLRIIALDLIARGIENLYTRALVRSGKRL